MREKSGKTRELTEQDLESAIYIRSSEQAASHPTNIFCLLTVVDLPFGHQSKVVLSVTNDSTSSTTTITTASSSSSINTTVSAVSPAAAAADGEGKFAVHWKDYKGVLVNDGAVELVQGHSQRDTLYGRSLSLPSQGSFLFLIYYLFLDVNLVLRTLLTLCWWY